jgi:hypothetical protein
VRHYVRVPAELKTLTVGLVVTGDFDAAELSKALGVKPTEVRGPMKQLRPPTGESPIPPMDDWEVVRKWIYWNYWLGPIEAAWDEEVSYEPLLSPLLELLEREGPALRDFAMRHRARPMVEFWATVAARGDLPDVWLNPEQVRVIADAGCGIEVWPSTERSSNDVDT